MENLSTFDALGIRESLGEKLSAQGILRPTAVQGMVIPRIASLSHVFFQSETGTGKTLAYLLPLLERSGTDADQRAGPGIIIAAPTYELASQIKREVQKLIPDRNVALCIGGVSIQRQIESLRHTNAPVVVGNPGRLTELIALRKLKTNGIFALVLDEADRLFSPEQRDETAALMSQVCRKGVQVIACSATLRENVRALLVKHIPAQGESQTPEVILLPADGVLTGRIEHQGIYCEHRDKADALRRYLAAVQPPKALVFTARADDADQLFARLVARHIPCAILHAKLGKMERKSALEQFRSGTLPVMVTSDLAARGLDIPGITHIIQMDCPRDSDFFIHRAGRTARTGTTGVNVVIGDRAEMFAYAALEKKLGIIVHPKELYGGKLMAPEQDP
ncbi:MAG: DEAD/DEAH box helicase [Spirochaetaceae bacterium]|jgi:superfamily II DNA/RNA helicase|nr:DEAD/DEAH box helicase [Spirochaetaceae bacterium]